MHDDSTPRVLRSGDSLSLLRAPGDDGHSAGQVGMMRQGSPHA
ncbi:hypothetical protein CEV32_0015 [Brucella rhizosphaerae]|uniref:Uncharacterized protein n=1 Tax=Brucella rhizosphaerae TaxID=571254 RepID=A0A256FGT0_9HYPH|nr:hypothetical protein CEV32_0015 [Brucella rhizosphaerae]